MRGRTHRKDATPRRSRYQVTVDALCVAFGMPKPDAYELVFHPQRKWRFDAAWTAPKVALEIQGGVFVQGRHTRGAALLGEWEKLNAAAGLGWRVLFARPSDLTACVVALRDALAMEAPRAAGAVGLSVETPLVSTRA